MRPFRSFIATLVATAGAAQAQTPGIQIVGAMDLGLGSFKSVSVGPNALSVANLQVVNGGLSTSYWGLRGSEPLADGWSADFELNAFLRPQTGAAGRSDAMGAPVNVAADPFWSKHAWVGLSSRRYGRLRLGNTTTALFLNAIASNAFGDSTVVSPLNLVTFFGSPLSGGTSWSNQVVYDTPRWGGFGLTGAVSASDGQNGRNHALRASWADGPVAFSAAWQKVEKDPATFADGTSANNTRAWQVGGSVDFGRARVWAHLGGIRNLGTAAAPQDADHRIVELSVAVPVGAGRVLAGYAQRDTDDTVGPVPATAAGGNLARRVFTIGCDHALSKRTDVYAMLVNDRTVTFTLGAPPAPLSARANNALVGIRHKF